MDKLALPPMLVGCVDSGPDCLCAGNYLKFGPDMLNYEQWQDHCFSY